MMITVQEDWDKILTLMVVVADRVCAGGADEGIFPQNICASWSHVMVEILDNGIPRHEGDPVSHFSCLSHMLHSGDAVHQFRHRLCQHYSCVKYLIDFFRQICWVLFWGWPLWGYCHRAGAVHLLQYYTMERWALIVHPKGWKVGNLTVYRIL